VQAQLQKLDPQKLKPHALNHQIYGDTCDNELVEAMREEGDVAEPIIIAADGHTVVSGHRRLSAALQLRWPAVTCLVRRDLTDNLDIAHALIRYNAYRQKTVEQRAREFAKLREIESARARERQRAGKSQPAQIGQPESFAPTGRTDTAVGQIVGLKPTSARQALKVIEAIDQAEQEGDGARAGQLRTLLNTKSIKAAHDHLQPMLEPQPGQEISPLRIGEELLRKYVGPLARGLDTLARANGGQGTWYRAADDALETVSRAISQMKQGLQ
jgi:ParB-like chromosome segregation protein Spo0J